MRTEEDFKILKYRMKEEGFDYCFDGYSSWIEIKDEKFHELREKYLDSKKELKKYIEDKNKQHED